MQDHESSEETTASPSGGEQRSELNPINTERLRTDLEAAITAVLRRHLSPQPQESINPLANDREIVGGGGGGGNVGGLGERLGQAVREFIDRVTGTVVTEGGRGERPRATGPQDP